MKHRYDVVWDPYGVHIEEHFCREWDEDGGCYGTNPNHGIDWEDAKQFVADYYRGRLEYWGSLTEDEWRLAGGLRADMTQGDK